MLKASSSYCGWHPRSLSKDGHTLLLHIILLMHTRSRRIGLQAVVVACCIELASSEGERQKKFGFFLQASSDTCPYFVSLEFNTSLQGTISKVQTRQVEAFAVHRRHFMWINHTRKNWNGSSKNGCALKAQGPFWWLTKTTAFFYFFKLSRQALVTYNASTATCLKMYVSRVLLFFSSVFVHPYFIENVTPLTITRAH